MRWVGQRVGPESIESVFLSWTFACLATVRQIVTFAAVDVSLLRGMVRVWCSTDCTDIGVVNGVGVRHTLHDKFTDSTFVENKDLGESNPSSSTRPKNLTQRNVRRRNVKDRTASSSGGASRASSHIGYSGEGSSFVHNEVH
ncbi:hypothetical protein Tco_1059844 [Tanacetum coccineum]